MSPTSMPEDSAHANASRKNKESRSPKPADTISRAISSLFDEPPVPRDIAMQLLNSWIANLQATETKISRGLLAMVSLFVAFLALDLGILTKLTFQGAEIRRTGILLCVVPIAISYLYYRQMSQVWFTHDLRTAIALLYKRLHEAVYYSGLDLFTHTESIRNLEALDSFRAPSAMRQFYERTTDVVTIFFVAAPLVAVVYCMVRLWNYPDVGMVLWVLTIAISALFFVRGVMFGISHTSPDDEFSLRRRNPMPKGPNGHEGET